MIIIGIDPGKSGAVAILNTDSNKWILEDTAGTDVEMSYQVNYNPASSIKTHAFVEKVHAMPGQGVVSMFTFGQNYGTWLGILATLGIPYTLVAPQTWKKALMADMPKDKGASVQRALQLFPNMVDSFKRKKDHNRADAILIAEYGRRLLDGRIQSSTKA